jgi:hypothetical protein
MASQGGARWWPTMRAAVLLGLSMLDVGYGLLHTLHRHPSARSQMNWSGWECHNVLQFATPHFVIQTAWPLAACRARSVGDMCLMLACKSKKSGMAMCWKRLCTWLGQRAPEGKVHTRHRHKHTFEHARRHKTQTPTHMHPQCAHARTHASS